MMKKILIVEDDKKISMALAVRLKAAKYDVVAACDAVQAGIMATKHRPDLILLDISIPGGNGFIVAERLQDCVAMAGVPFIFLTASKQPGLREKAMELGAAGFFEKPYEAGELLDAIQEALAQSRGDSGRTRLPLFGRARAVRRQGLRQSQTQTGMKQAKVVADSNHSPQVQMYTYRSPNV